MSALDRPSLIKCKEKRNAVMIIRKKLLNEIKLKEHKQRKKDEKADPKLKEERLLNNVPKTIESMRRPNESIVEADDEEVFEEEQVDEFSEYFQTGKTPKIVLTTSKNPASAVYEFAEELVSIFPGAEFVKRQAQYDIKHIMEFSGNRGFTDVIIVNEDRKVVNALTVIHLPNGPTAYYKLSNIVCSKAIRNHGRTSAHMPELILNHFNSRLGHTVGRMFAALFPPVPEFKGRQVCTFHNQRDFIFFRRHRYMFKDGERVDLQEIGPRFTLKLRWIQKGLFDMKNGEYEWMYTADMGVDRKKFYL